MANELTRIIMGNLTRRNTETTAPRRAGLSPEETALLTAEIHRTQTADALPPPPQKKRQRREVPGGEARAISLSELAERRR